MRQSKLSHSALNNIIIDWQGFLPRLTSSRYFSNGSKAWQNAFMRKMGYFAYTKRKHWKLWSLTKHKHRIFIHFIWNAEWLIRNKILLNIQFWACHAYHQYIRIRYINLVMRTFVGFSIEIYDIYIVEFITLWNGRENHFGSRDFRSQVMAIKLMELLIKYINWCCFFMLFDFVRNHAALHH